MNRKPLVLFLALVLLVGSAGRAAAPPPPAATPAAPVAVTILHVNDTHGHTEPYLLNGRSVGGYSRLATVVEEVRREGRAARVFLLHAGDILSKSDDLTRATLGAANIAILNHLKFDIFVPGNGEFYDGVPNLQKRMAEARFPVLAANVTLRQGGACLAKPYVIERAGPARIAFFGLCFIKTEYRSADPVRLADPIETARALVPALRKEADVVVAVTHIGLGQDRRLAQAVEGMDLIVGAHSHNRLSQGERVKRPDGSEVLIVQAGAHLEFLGRVDLDLVPKGGRWVLESARARLVPLDDQVRLDPTVTALIARLAEAALKKPPRPAPEPVGAGTPP